MAETAACRLARSSPGGRASLPQLALRGAATLIDVFGLRSASRTIGAMPASGQCIQQPAQRWCPAHRIVLNRQESRMSHDQDHDLKSLSAAACCRAPPRCRWPASRPGRWRSSSPPPRSTPPSSPITDTEVTVGQLHSATGTMAISRDRLDPGRAARHRPDQRDGRRPRPQDQGHQGRRRLRLADLRREEPRSCWSTTRSPPCSAAGPRPRARPCCRSSRRKTACSTTRPSTKAWSRART